MKVLITGIDGFVGPNLASELIKRGNDVVGTFHRDIDEEKFEFPLYKVNILEFNEIKSVIKETKPNVIYHLAAQSSAAVSWKHPQLTLSVNLIGTTNLLEVVKEYSPDTRVVVIGSAEEYGVVYESELPVKESNETRAGNPYSLSKIMQEDLAKFYMKYHNLDIVLTRSFNHTGIGQSEIFVLPNFAKQLILAEKGISEPVISVGNLNTKRDFLGIEDIIRAYINIAEKGVTGEIYNVGSGVSYSIQELLDYMISNIDCKISIIEDSNRMRPSDNPNIVADNNKLKNLGWCAESNIFEVIDSIMNYWRGKVDGK